MKLILAMAKVSCQILRIILTAALVFWVTMAPLVWILRDGLGPGMVESVGLQAAYKFLGGWGVPALLIVWLLVGLYVVERLLSVPAELEVEE